MTSCCLVNTRRHKPKDSKVHVARGVACGSGAATPGGSQNGGKIHTSNGKKKIDFRHSSNFKLFGQGKGNSINITFLKFTISIRAKKKTSYASDCGLIKGTIQVFAWWHSRESRKTYVLYSKSPCSSTGPSKYESH